MFALERLGGMRALGVVGSLPAALFQSSSDSQHRAAWASMPRGVQWYLCWVGLGVKSVTRCLHTNLLPKKDLSFDLCKSICFFKVWHECGSNTGAVFIFGDHIVGHNTNGRTMCFYLSWRFSTLLPWPFELQGKVLAGHTEETLSAAFFRLISYKLITFLPTAPWFCKLWCD